MRDGQGRLKVVEAVDKKSPVTVHRRRFLKAATAAAGSTLLPEVGWGQTLAAPPRSYDLRNDNGKNYITAVKDQEEPLPCNACTAFAIAAAVEGTFNKKNQLTGSPDTLGPNLDEMELFLRPAPGFPGDVASGGCGTSHWWPKHALARCKSPAPGIMHQGSTPPKYIQVDFKSLLSENPNLSAKKNLEQTQADMKCWIRSKGPVAAVMVQYEDLYAWGKVWGEQYPGIANPNVYAPGKLLSVCSACPPATSASVKPAVAARKRPRVPIVGGHVVAIVGYDGNKSWICKNSWGSDWNGDGYVSIEQGDFNGPERLGVGGCYIDLIDVWGVFLDNPTCT